MSCKYRIKLLSFMKCSPSIRIFFLKSIFCFSSGSSHLIFMVLKFGAKLDSATVWNFFFMKEQEGIK